MQAIAAGQVVPINPTEGPSQHVFVFNNLFFSYAVDTRDAYKVLLGGDRDAVKGAKHDFRNLQLLTHLEFGNISTCTAPNSAAATAAAEGAAAPGAAAVATAAATEPGRMCTLATCLVDAPAMSCGKQRVVVQSIIPGILNGDQASKLIFGAIAHGAPLARDPLIDAHLKHVAKQFHMATRSAPLIPLTEAPQRNYDRAAVAAVAASGNDKDKDGKGGGKGALCEVTGAVEVKGILGGEGRKYVLDVMRLTPRDANSVPATRGGTGNWEKQSSSSSSGAFSAVQDDHVALLRPELVQRWMRRQQELALAVEAAKENASEFDDEGDEKKKTATTSSTKESAAAVTKDGAVDDLGAPLNVNVFMPFAAAMDAAAVTADEERVRRVSDWLWTRILPCLTQQVRVGGVLPLDGKVLVDVLHSYGVNLRYMGRLAQLALAEEQRDNANLTAAYKAAAAKVLATCRELHLYRSTYIS